MRSEILFIILFFKVFTLSEAILSDGYDVEARGKHKDIGLFVYFADLIIKKIFVLKLIYAFVFWLVLHKAGYFLAWFISYLKEKKQEIHHDDHHYYKPSHGQYGPSYGPYRRRT